MIELKNFRTTSDNSDIQQGMIQLTSVPILSDVVVISIIVLTPNYNSWIVPPLHLVSDLQSVSWEILWLQPFLYIVLYSDTVTSHTYDDIKLGTKFYCGHARTIVQGDIFCDTISKICVELNITISSLEKHFRV